MAIRTTVSNVRAIVDIDSEIIVVDADLDPFIEIASHLVTIHCEPEGAGVLELELVERWLAAHFYHVRDQRPGSKKAGAAGESYKMEIDKGLDSTQYGQHAMLTDSSNALKQLNKRVTENVPKSIGVLWAGTDKDLSGTLE